MVVKHIKALEDEFQVSDQLHMPFVLLATGGQRESMGYIGRDSDAAFI